MNNSDTACLRSLSCLDEEKLLLADEEILLSLLVLCRSASPVYDYVHHHLSGSCAVYNYVHLPGSLQLPCLEEDYKHPFWRIASTPFGGLQQLSTYSTLALAE
ncbi:unnamed protein product [Amoebophrya sp. A25]|nr:unnamed protein product [Amoebophrya sp. A25]|eukprot:GSA25T00020234001.1